MTRTALMLSAAAAALFAGMTSAQQDSSDGEMERPAETAVEEAGDAAEAAGQAAENAGEAAAETAGDAAEAAGDAAGDAASATAEAAGDAVEATEEAAGDAAQAAGETAQDAADATADASADAMQAAEEAGDDAAQAAGEMAEDAGEAVDETADAATDEMAADAPAGDLAGMTVAEVTGMVVYGPDAERIGDIDYVVAGANGPEAVIGIGGFLGIGEYTVALPLAEFEMMAEQEGLSLDATRETLEQRPEFDESSADPLPDDAVIADLMDGANTGGTPAGDADGSMSN